MKIQVTTPCFDDIGKVLKNMDLPFEDYSTKNKIDCDILFMNCGTHDVIDKTVLKKFVQNGGVLYASDLTSSFLDETFPNTFEFDGSGEPCTLDAEIIDARLIEYIGKNISITFDLTGWSMLDHIMTGKVIMKRIDTGKPLMVEVPYDNGRIYYTSFHNHNQASDKEIALLKILILTQLSAKSNKTIKEMADFVNFNVDRIKEKYGNNETQIETLQQSRQFDTQDNEKQIESIMDKWSKQPKTSQKSQQKETNFPDVDSIISKF